MSGGASRPICIVATQYVAITPSCPNPNPERHVGFGRETTTEFMCQPLPTGRTNDVFMSEDVLCTCFIIFT